MKHEKQPKPMKPNRYDPIAAALQEDIGVGDITTEFFVPESLHATGRIIAHEKAIVAGSGATAEVFRQVDPSTDGQIILGDSTEVAPGEDIIEVCVIDCSNMKEYRCALDS